MNTPDVQVRKNSNGSWSVYLDGRMISDHRTYDGAATSANQHLAIARRENLSPTKWQHEALGFSEEIRRYVEGVARARSEQLESDCLDAVLAQDYHKLDRLIIIEAPDVPPAVASRLPCPNDTDGDGDCGRRHCPWCGPWH